MNEGEYVTIDGHRCRVTVPLGSGHPTIAFAALRVSDGMRLIIFADGEYLEALS